VRATIVNLESASLLANILNRWRVFALLNIVAGGVAYYYPPILLNLRSDGGWH